jgi:hypothetical protein
MLFAARKRRTPQRQLVAEPRALGAKEAWLMRTRLLAVLGALVVMLAVAVAPAAAAGAGDTTGHQGIDAVLGPGQTVLADHTPSDGCSCSWGGSPPGMSGWGGSPWGMGFGWGGPWWAGMPLWTISASSGGTWPWAPWYYTPQWWTAAALMR